MAEIKPYKDALERLAGKHGRVYFSCTFKEISLRQRIEQDFPGFAIQFDSGLNFTRNNHPAFNEHPNFTVRYAPHCVRLPKHPKRKEYLDCILSEDDKKETLGLIEIDSEVVVWSVKHFPNKAAQLCGFDDSNHMITELSRMYKKNIPRDDTLSLYRIRDYIPLKR